jgi:hypothetical protein
MMVVLALIVGVLLWLFGDAIKAIAGGELRGAVFDRCERCVAHAEAMLPQELAADVASEWRAELTELESRDRALKALQFARSLPEAARSMRGSRASSRCAFVRVGSRTAGVIVASLRAQPKIFCVMTTRQQLQMLGAVVVVAALPQIAGESVGMSVLNVACLACGWFASTVQDELRALRGKSR